MCLAYSWNWSEIRKECSTLDRTRKAIWTSSRVIKGKMSWRRYWVWILSCWAKLRSKRVWQWRNVQSRRKKWWVWLKLIIIKWSKDFCRLLETFLLTVWIITTETTLLTFERRSGATNKISILLSTPIYKRCRTTKTNSHTSEPLKIIHMLFIQMELMRGLATTRRNLQ